VGRRRFDHLFAEVSLAAGRLVPRYPLWLALHEAGCDPEGLSRAAALSFCRSRLPRFLREHGLALRPAAARRLLREVERFDPGRRTPYEIVAALGS
jgi:hypothetical protein